jgi:ABC-type Fe3+/spermidine/putrescine transport system ATPase subunit
LAAEFEKRFAGGPTIRVQLRQPADVFSLTVLFGPSGSGKSTTLRQLRHWLKQLRISGLLVTHDRIEALEDDDIPMGRRYPPT